MSEIGKYQTMELVASGGTAVLHKAIQTSLDRVVAIKRLHQHLTDDENFTRRFILEAKAAASLDQDNIVKIIDFGSDDDSYFMVMEFIEGESLRGVLDRHRRLSPDVALAIAYEVCRGLEHAHSKGIIHRDIKPGNVMVTRSGKVKITDFGLAKLTESATQHTATNSILGTPLYMSPEQAYGESVDHRSDLFSLGTMLYEMMTGVQPFRDESYMGVIQNIINRNAPHPSRHDIELPGTVQSLLSKAMNKNREARFSTAREFMRAIETYMGLERLRAAVDGLRHLLDTNGDTIVMSGTSDMTEKRRRTRGGVAVVAALAIVVGSAGAAYLWSPDTLQPVIERLFAPGATREPPRVQQSHLGDGSNPFLDAIAAVNPAALPVDSVAKVDPTPATADTLTRLEIAERVTGGPSAAADTSPDTESAPVDSASTVPSTPSAARPAPVAGTGPGATAPREGTSRPTDAITRPGWLSVRSDTPAEVWVDGRYRGTLPSAGPIELLAGTHTLECRSPDHHPYVERVRITAGEMSIRNVILERRTGHLMLQATSGAEVFVDGSLRGTTPLAGPIQLDAGTHQVTIKKAGFNVWNNQIQVEANETFSLNITLSPIY